VSMGIAGAFISRPSQLGPATALKQIADVSADDSGSIDTSDYALLFCSFQFSSVVSGVLRCRFNGDTGNNYAYNTSENLGAPVIASSQPYIELGATPTTKPGLVTFWANNDPANQRMVNGQWARTEDYMGGFSARWANTAVISRITFTSGGAFTDPRIVVLGI